MNYTIDEDGIPSTIVGVERLYWKVRASMGKKQPRLDDDGQQPYRVEIVSGNDTHWCVRYTYHIPGGYKYETVWELRENKK